MHQKPPKKRRAIIVTGIIAVVLLLPIAIMLKLDDRLPEGAAAGLGKVPDFLVKDTTGAHMSRFDLEGNLTIVGYFGDTCVAPDVQACTRAIKYIDELTRFVEARLLYSNKTETSPVRLVAVATAPLTLAGPWRHVAAATPADVAVFVPEGQDGTRPSLAVIDQSGEFIFWSALSDSERLDGLRPFLSKLTIQHYMHDYLAKRTFFRRVPKATAN